MKIKTQIRRWLAHKADQSIHEAEWHYGNYPIGSFGWKIGELWQRIAYMWWALAEEVK